MNDALFRIAKKDTILFCNIVSRVIDCGLLAAYRKHSVINLTMRGTNNIIRVLSHIDIAPHLRFDIFSTLIKLFDNLFLLARKMTGIALPLS